MTSLKKLVIDKGVCPLPWMHSEVFYSGNAIKPCCKYKENVNHPDNNFISAWQGESFQKLRDDLLNGKHHANCSACDVPKDAFSYKKFKIHRYLKNGFLDNIDVNVLTAPRVLHLSTADNTCNLACRMCSPDNSSKLAAIDSLKRFYPLHSLNDRNAMVEYLEGSLDSIMQVTFSGGEPMLDKRLPELIDKISKSKDLKVIGFSTNMTTLNYGLLEKLSQLDNVKTFFSVSLDGPVTIQEYIRYGCNYQSIVDNLKYIKDRYQDKFIFNINSTVSVYNVGYVQETLESFLTIKAETGIDIYDIMTSPVLNPEFLHPGILPGPLKEFYLDKLSKIDISRYNVIPKAKELLDTSVALLKENKQNLYNSFIEFNNEFDKVSGKDFLSLYPEFKKVEEG